MTGACLIPIPFQWGIAVTPLIAVPNPCYEFFNDFLREIALVASPETKTDSLELRKLWTATTPIDEVIADEYLVYLSVIQHVVLIRSSVFKAVVRVHLAPFVGGFVTVIDIVTE